jgi:hypothetical protein
VRNWTPFVARLLTADDGGGYRSAGGVIGLAIALAAVLLAVRGVRLAVVVSAEHVLVRNLFKTHTILRRDVASVGLPRGLSLAPNLIGAPNLIKTGGFGRVRLDALSPGLLRFNLARAERLTSALGRALEVAIETS